MSLRFECATAGRIVFGAGTWVELADAIVPIGRNALWITGAEPKRVDFLSNRLMRKGIDLIFFQVVDEPTIDVVEQATRLARDSSCDMVIGVGGGSVLDVAKAVAVMATNTGELKNYLEVIGKGRRLERAGLPCIALPTTAGTGTEVTRNSVLGSPADRVKVSLRSALMLPRLALVDPELTLSLPPDVTASCGLDALTQLLEAFVSKRANPLTDSFCRQGLPLVARSLLRAYQEGSNLAAREDMALASLLSGLALGNGGLGAVHGIAGPFGGMFAAPHGTICARLLPIVMEANLQTLQAQDSKGPFRQRYDEIARILTASDKASAADGIKWLYALCQELQIPGLSKWGLTKKQFSVLVDRARRASSMQGNPVRFNAAQLEGLLAQAL